MKRCLLFLLVLSLYLLHQDFWNWNRVEPIFFGFVPVGLAYHAAYSFAASLMMWVMVRWAWPKHLEEVEPYRAETTSEAPR